MFKKSFINIVYANVFTENVLIVYTTTQEARFDWKQFFNIYKVAKEVKVTLKMFFFKHSS